MLSQLLMFGGNNMNLFDMYKENKDIYMVQDGDKDRYLVTYKSLGVDWNNRLTRKARGSVINSRGEYIVKSYDKFFNLGELDDRSDILDDVKVLSRWQDCGYDVTNKVDGSIIKVSYDKAYDEFVVCSSTSFNSEHVQRFKNYIEDKFNMDELKFWAKKSTLIFEYTSPETMIVINYDENVFLHGVIDNATEIEFDYKMVNYIASSINVNPVSKFNYTREQIEDMMKTETNIEGFVITFENGIKLKVKTDWYVNEHVGVSLFFGRANSKRKIDMVIDMFFDGTLDDFIYECKRRGRNDLTSLANDVIIFNSKVEAYASWVKDTYAEGTIDKKMIAKSFNDIEKAIAFAVINKKNIEQVFKKIIHKEIKQKWDEEHG